MDCLNAHGCSKIKFSVSMSESKLLLTFKVIIPYTYISIHSLLLE